MVVPRSARGEGRAISAATARSDDAEVLADALYAHHSKRGRFPAFWRAFDDRLDALRRIFHFFIDSRKMLDHDAQPALELLDARTRQRLRGEGRIDPPDPRSAPLRRLVQMQQQLFATLGDELIGPGFDAFASGSLAIHADINALPLSFQQIAFELPEPDSAYYLYWMEFALVALDLGEAPETWCTIARSLLRAQHIFVRAYGRVGDDGWPARDWTFDAYSKDTYAPLKPSDVEKIRFDDLRTPRQLGQATTRFIQRALPGGMGS